MPPKLQAPIFIKKYRTRESGRGLGKLRGFMDLPMDVVYEVSLRRTISSQCERTPMLQAYSSRPPCISIQKISYIFPDFRSNLGLCLRLALRFSSGKLLIATLIESVSKTLMRFSLLVFFMTNVAW